MDKQAIQNLIKELIQKTTTDVKEISITTEDCGETTWFRVEVGQPHLFTGRAGEGLFALNHLVRRIIESKMPTADEGQENPKGLSILVDINDFQKKRIENIHAIAHMMAERARYFKSNIEIDPMPAFERRVVHEFLANENDLKTESTGEGMSRRVVIKYIGTI
ncbi:MAG: R3H domain-containing nucleic acid-binding protein [Minisyncoccia bacterium]